MKDGKKYVTETDKQTDQAIHDPRLIIADLDWVEVALLGKVRVVISDFDYASINELKKSLLAVGIGQYRICYKHNLNNRVFEIYGTKNLSIWKSVISGRSLNNFQGSIDNQIKENLTPEQILSSKRWKEGILVFPAIYPLMIRMPVLKIDINSVEYLSVEGLIKYLEKYNIDDYGVRFSKSFNGYVFEVYKERNILILKSLISNIRDINNLEQMLSSSSNAKPNIIQDEHNIEDEYMDEIQSVPSFKDNYLKNKTKNSTKQTCILG